MHEDAAVAHEEGALQSVEQCHVVRTGSAESARDGSTVVSNGDAKNYSLTELQEKGSQRNQSQLCASITKTDLAPAVKFMGDSACSSYETSEGASEIRCPQVAEVMQSLQREAVAQPLHEGVDTADDRLTDCRESNVMCGLDPSEHVEFSDKASSCRTSPHILNRSVELLRFINRVTRGYVLFFFVSWLPQAELV